MVKKMVERENTLYEKYKMDFSKIENEQVGYDFIYEEDGSIKIKPTLFRDFIGRYIENAALQNPGKMPTYKDVYNVLENILKRQTALQNDELKEYDLGISSLFVDTLWREKIARSMHLILKEYLKEK